MKKMALLFAGAVVAMAVQLFADPPMVTAVTAQQHYPWNGKVDIVVTISGEESEVANATCTFAATNVGPKKGGHWEIVKPQPQTGRNGEK